MVNQYVYVPTKWMNDIIECDEFGKPVPEVDESGNIVYETDLNGIIVLHPITREPIPKYRRLQHGTGHSAARDNNQEQGIAKSHERLDSHAKDILRLRVQLELDGRAPGNSGTFADTFDGEPNKLIRQTAMADLTSAVSVGSTELPVDNVTDFVPFTQVTVYDGTNTEDVLITAIGDGVIIVQALDNDYVKGARIARSNSRITDGQMVNGSWGTYSVSLMEVV